MCYNDFKARLKNIGILKRNGSSMIYSMTGYGRGESGSGSRRFIVEIKSLNHRYCDVHIRLPRQFFFLEETARKELKQKITRGKIDIYVTYEDMGDETRKVLTDTVLAGMYADACRTLKDEFGLKDDISVSLVAGFPDVLRTREAEEDDETKTIFMEAVTQAIDSLMSMRRSEGHRLKKDIAHKASLISKVITDIEDKASTVVQEYREKLRSRIKELLEQQTIDENRLETECAYMADRCSIEEELVRLKSHVRQIEDTLDAQGPAGRRLDFLTQEMNREANTIGSKSNCLEITKGAVELKCHIDNIKEQVQNIE